MTASKAGKALYLFKAKKILKMWTNGYRKGNPIVIPIGLNELIKKEIEEFEKWQKDPGFKDET